MVDSRSAVLSGGIDWAAHWREMVRRREAQTDVLQYQATRPGSDFWERRAKQFRRRAVQRQAEGHDGFLGRVFQYVDSETTVVDVGSGVGRLTIPLASRAKRVIAVERAGAMVELLRAELRAAGLDNVEVIARDWELAEISPADVVVCAHVLYPIAEAAEFVRKLDATATRAVFVQLHAEQPDVPAIDAWREVYAAERLPQPGFVEAVNLLAQLGIFAATEYHPSQRSWRYPTFEEAYEDLRDRLVVQPGTPQAAKLEAFVRPNLDRIGDDWSFQPVSLHAGTAWWVKE